MTTPFEACDVLIVGGGFAGLMCADRLTRLGYAVTLVEEGESLLNGTSSRNEGWLHAGTYHSLSIQNRTEASLIAARCRTGWVEIQRRFPECIEYEEFAALAVVKRSRLEAVTDRWSSVGVGHRLLAAKDLAHVGGDAQFAEDEAVFEVEDLGVNTRMLAAALSTKIRQRGGRILLGTTPVERNGNTVLVRGLGGESSIEYRFLVNATGYRAVEASALLDLPKPAIRLWRSHLITVPRLARASVFSVEPGEAAMINHAHWSIVGFNEDATLIDEASFVVDLAARNKLVEAVRRRFPRSHPENGHVTACVKVDYAPAPQTARSLNIRVLPVLEDAVTALPGKMTESPFVADAIARHIFGRLGTNGVTHRPVDSLTVSPEQRELSNYGF